MDPVRIGDNVLPKAETRNVLAVSTLMSKRATPYQKSHQEIRSFHAVAEESD